MTKVLPIKKLKEMRKKWKRNGQIVVWTNGCFDILHVGHVRGLRAAKLQGDILIVGLNSDLSVRRRKGIGRPIVPESERAEIISSLACVDWVLIFNELTPTRVLKHLQPDVCCKGADYAPPHGMPLPERSVIDSYGGRMHFLPFKEGASSSAIINRILAGQRRLSLCK